MRSWQREMNGFDDRQSGFDGGEGVLKQNGKFMISYIYFNNCLAAYLTVCLSACLSACLSVSVCLCLSVYVCQSPQNIKVHSHGEV